MAKALIGNLKNLFVRLERASTFFSRCACTNVQKPETFPLCQVIQYDANGGNRLVPLNLTAGKLYRLSQTF